MKSRCGKVSIIVGWGMATASITALAGNHNLDSRWYIAPQYSYVWPGSGENTLNGSGWQLDVGKPLSDSVNLEFGVIDYGLNFKNAIPGSFHQTAYGVNILKFLPGTSRPWKTFALIGVGVNDQRASGASSSSNAYGEIGVGALISPWSWRGAIRIETQILHTFGNGNFTDSIVSIGLQIPLWAESQPAPAPEAQPMAQPVPEMPLRAAAPVPTAPVLVPVAALPKIIQLPGVEFALNSDRLLAVSKTTLDGVVRTLQDHPGIDAQVAGYTDSTGKMAYNLQLSQQRAAAVMDYLVDQGIAASRLEAKGYGEADPVASNQTLAGRAQNRRVVLRIIQQQIPAGRSRMLRSAERL